MEARPYDAMIALSQHLYKFFASKEQQEILAVVL